MHSENLTDHERCLELARRYGDDEFSKYAEQHADIIRCFGRFPHRNAVLGRAATLEEQAFLTTAGFCRLTACHCTADRAARTSLTAPPAPLRWLIAIARSPARSRRESQLRALVRLGERIAAGAAGEAALRADRQPFELDVLRRLVHSASQAVHGFERRRLAADDPQHNSLSFRHESQRRKIACARRVIFEQEMVCLGTCEETLRHPVVPAVGEMATPEIAAAHVDADDDVRRASLHAPLMASV